MKVNIFTAADTVKVYEQGKLVIIGTFDNIRAEKCPFVKQFGVALKLIAERNDYKKSYKMSLILRKMGTKKAMTEIALPLKFPELQKSRKTSAIFVAEIVGKFDSFGTYVLELKRGSKIISDIQVNAYKAKTVKDNGKTKTKVVKKRKK